jgi:hypothetical protein
MNTMISGIGSGISTGISSGSFEAGEGSFSAYGDGGGELTRKEWKAAGKPGE